MNVVLTVAWRPPLNARVNCVGGDGEPAEVDARAAGVHEHSEGPREVVPGRR